MMINIIAFLWYKSVENTVDSGTAGKNDNCYRKGRGRGSESYDRNYHKCK